MEPTELKGIWVRLTQAYGGAGGIIYMRLYCQLTTVHCRLIKEVYYGQNL